MRRIIKRMGCNSNGRRWAEVKARRQPVMISAQNKEHGEHCPREQGCFLCAPLAMLIAVAAVC